MSFSIRRIPFDRSHVDDWSRTNPTLTSWPVVYVLDSAGRQQKLYVGEAARAHKGHR